MSDESRIVPAYRVTFRRPATPADGSQYSQEVIASFEEPLRELAADLRAYLEVADPGTGPDIRNAAVGYSVVLFRDDRAAFLTLLDRACVLFGLESIDAEIAPVEFVKATGMGWPAS
jgi:hypothetical protein